MKVPVLESVFLNRSPRPEERDLRRVLVLGGDGTGRELAGRLIAEGFNVVLVGNGEEPGGPEGASVPPETVVEQVQGVVGGFDVRLATPAGTSTECVGFVVAAPPLENLPKYEDYGLPPSDRVMALSDLEKLLPSGACLPQPRGEWFHAVFLCGLEGGADPGLFARVFDAIDGLRKTGKVQPYVFTRQVKVAAAGLERRYRQIRESGTLFFKFDDEKPTFKHGADGCVVRFVDPLLRMEMELVPDLIVVDEYLLPSHSLKPLLDAIPSSAVSAPFLQPESTRFAGVTTAKAGMFALGPARGNFSPDARETELESVLVAVKTAARNETAEGLPGPPQVDPAKCTICLTCVRLCPHGAISFQKRAEADPLSCVRCGICAAECPMDAIRLAPAAGEQDIVGRIEAGLAASTSGKKILAFLCSKSAARAMDSTGIKMGRKVTPIRVPCAGTVDLSHIVTAFQKGAYGVLVSGCHTGNCASVYGTVLAAGRASQAGLMLEESGIDPGRLLYTTLASNTPGDFVRAVLELESRIGNTGQGGDHV